MDQQSWLTERFEENRPRLRGVAYRMLGSLSEAEDAVQEAWLRLSRADAATVENLSRARRRVRGAPAPSDSGRARQREVVEAFLRAVRAGDLEGLLAVLDPDAIIRIDAAARAADPAATDRGKPREVRGAATWAKQLLALSRGLRYVQPALIDGSVGVLLAPRGKLSRVMTFTFANDKVTRVDVIGDAARLRELDITAF